MSRVKHESTSVLPPPPAESARRDIEAWLAWVDAAFDNDRERRLHSRGVWQRISSALRTALAQLDEQRMHQLELAALVHDIGRAIDPGNTEPHGFAGARYLDALGLHDIASLVAHHSGAKLEALDRDMGHLDEWPTVDRELLAYLDYADRTVNAAGQTVTLAERRADIAARRGADSASVRRFDAQLPALQLAELAFVTG